MNNYYYVRVLTQAVKDTKCSLAAHPRNVLVGFVIWSIAAAIGTYRFGLSETLSEVRWYTLIVIASASLFLLILVMALIRAPIVLDRKMSNSIAEKDRELQHQKQDFVDTVRELNQHIEQLKLEKHAITIADPVKNMQRAQLREYLDKLVKLRASLATGESSAFPEFHSFDNTVANYVQQGFPFYRKYSLIHPTGRNYTKKLVYSQADTDTLVPVCDERIEALEELLRHLG